MVTAQGSHFKPCVRTALTSTPYTNFATVYEFMLDQVFHFRETVVQLFYRTGVRIRTPTNQEVCRECHLDFRGHV